ncbi:MAG: sigma 54-interacting transcriptional regulator [Candidatus Hydrogenedentes bacterium]|nr:sigma 54-interacting transcriptional regulator [Candidatus Hydrogenedentota bacterium]
MGDDKIDQLRSVISNHMTAEKLRPLQIAIRNGNNIAYRAGLTSLIRDILDDMSKQIAVMASLDEVSVLTSYHASSIILSGWLRVTQSRQVWERTTFAQTEIDTFRRIYDWDARPGHLMTDPGGQESIDVIFCRDGILDNKCCVTPATWRISRRLLHSVLFPVLVEHALDGVKPDNFAMAAQCVRASRGIVISEADFQELNDLSQALNDFDFWKQSPSDTMPFFRVRSFLVTFFYTIGRCAMPDMSANSPLIVRDGAKFERIVAYGVHPENIGLVPNDSEKIGSLALVTSHKKKSTLSYDVADALRAASEFLAKSLRCFELDAAANTSHVRTTTPDEEDSIRQACEVDYLADTEEVRQQPGLEQLLRLSRSLHEAIAHRLIKAHYTDEAEAAVHKNKCSNTPTGVPVCLPVELMTDMTIQKLLLECDIVGSSRQYVQMVHDLAAVAATDDLSETRVVFLDSEPGCGKEMLAKLLHLFSRRAHLDAHAKLVVPRLKPMLEDLKGCLEPLICQDHKEHSVFKAVTAVLTNPPGSDYCMARLSNYFTLNMAALTDEERFMAELFGSYSEEDKIKKAGRCFMAHALSGTVFLDELNTLPTKDQANSFLRLLEKPFEMEIPGRSSGPIRDANMFIVFASNKTREELIEAGFNEAVVYRITKTRIHIPPLRERPADIAVFVNARVRKHNERRCKAGKVKEQIRKIDIQAMRLLCELRWPDNYRGVQGLMDDISGDRIQRGIEHPELTFDEILRGLRRREAFQADVTRGKTESKEHSARQCK